MGERSGGTPSKNSSAQPFRNGRCIPCGTQRGPEQLAVLDGELIGRAGEDLHCDRLERWLMSVFSCDIRQAVPTCLGSPTVLHLLHLLQVLHRVADKEVGPQHRSPNPMSHAAISRLTADLVASSDREHVEAALEAMAADDRFPTELVEQICSQVRALTEGHDILVFDSEALLTTNQAAGLLGFSRPHLVKLCDRGDIPFHLVGRDRRIRASDVALLLEQRAADRALAAEMLARADDDRDSRVAQAAGLPMDRARALGL